MNSVKKTCFNCKFFARYKTDGYCTLSSFEPYRTILYKKNKRKTDDYCNDWIAIGERFAKVEQ